MSTEGTQGEGPSTQKSRRVWRKAEEDALLRCMVNEYSDKWSADNGFRPGFFTLLESEMKKVMPASCLKAHPHIDSKLRYWKVTYHKICDVVNLSGFGWDDATKRIVVDDERVWAEYEKAYPKKAKGIYGKSFPYYDQWVIMFGKDRATGERAEVPSQMAEEDTMEVEIDGGSYYPIFGEEFFSATTSENPVNLDNTPPSSTTPTSTPPSSTPSTATPHTSLPTASPRNSIPSANAGTKKGKKRTRMGEDDLSIHTAMEAWLTKTEGHMGDMAKSLGYSNKQSARRESVPNELSKLDLTVGQRFKLVAVICASEERTDSFFGTKDEDKQLWVDAILNGEVYGPV